jgi:hypothetical protein
MTSPPVLRSAEFPPEFDFTVMLFVIFALFCWVRVVELVWFTEVVLEESTPLPTLPTCVSAYAGATEAATSAKATIALNNLFVILFIHLLSKIFIAIFFR